MINVCKNCLRLNPLGNKACVYCQGKCQEMTSLQLSQFIVKQIERKQRRGKMSKNGEKDEMRPFNICKGCGADHSQELGRETCPSCGGKVELILAKPSELAQKLAQVGIHKHPAVLETKAEASLSHRIVPF